MLGHSTQRTFMLAHTVLFCRAFGRKKSAEVEEFFSAKESLLYRFDDLDCSHCPLLVVTELTRPGCKKMNTLVLGLRDLMFFGCFLMRLQLELGKTF